MVLERASREAARQLDFLADAQLSINCNRDLRQQVAGPAGGDAGRIHSPPDDLRLGATAPQRLDLPTTQNQSLLRHPVWLEGRADVLATRGTRAPTGHS